jgi:putative mRNA 3-end processing factor
MPEVLSLAPQGLHCAAGSFHIDPWRPVARAVITHGHADHARPGHGAYLCTPEAAPVLRHRLGDVPIQTLAYGTPLSVGGARVSLHPAGHVPGSAQVRVEVAGQVAVASGDYKLEDDRLSTPFEPVRCHSFVSECTFGLPVFTWAPQAQVVAEITGWVQAAMAEGRTPVIAAYSLGKAQRLIVALAGLAPILTHPAIEATTAVMRAQGLALPPTEPVTDPKAQRGRLVIAPPAALDSGWLKRFGPVATASASGWMRLRGIRRRRGVERGFVISDHADWTGLNAAIAATGAETVHVTHGYTAVFRRWLATQGYDARILATEFAGEDAEEGAA